MKLDFILATCLFTVGWFYVPFMVLLYCFLFGPCIYKFCYIDTNLQVTRPLWSNHSNDTGLLMKVNSTHLFSMLHFNVTSQCYMWTSGTKGLNYQQVVQLFVLTGSCLKAITKHQYAEYFQSSTSKYQKCVNLFVLVWFL